MPLFANSRAKGRYFESLAKRHLRARGLTPVAQNVVSPYGEIDLIMRDGDEWVFVEVRYRQSSAFGGGLESVDQRKRKKLIKSAEHYMQTEDKSHFHACRFDIIEFSGMASDPECNWIQDAIQAE